MDRRGFLAATAALPAISLSRELYGIPKVQASNYPTLQEAINAAGVGGAIFVSGQHTIDHTLNHLERQLLIGEGASFGSLSPEGTTITSNVTSGFGHILPHNNQIIGIELRGPRTYDDINFSSSGPNVDCFSIDGSPRIIDSKITLWRNVAQLNSGTYYGLVRGGEIVRCVGGFLANHRVYNFSFEGARFALCDSVCDSDSSSSLWEGLKFMGGSIEGYRAAFNGIYDASFSQTYFETRNKTNIVYGFNMNNHSDPEMHLALNNCKIFMNHTDRFINYSGFPDATLTSIGNTIEVGSTIASDEATVSKAGHSYLVPNYPQHNGKITTLGDVKRFRNSVSESELKYINSENYLANKNIL